MTPPPLEQLLADQGRLVRRLAAEVVGDAHLAEDVAQEAWLRGLPAQAPAAEASAWWRTVIRNLGRSLRLSDGARQWRERAVARDEHVPSTHDELERTELVTRIASAVQALPEPYRGVVSMRYWDGLAPRDIARARGAPVATIKSQLQRGLQRLRAELADSDSSTRRGLMALALPASRNGLLVYSLLMQVNLKVIGAALALGALGVWGLATRGAPSPGIGPASGGRSAEAPGDHTAASLPVEGNGGTPELDGVGLESHGVAGARIPAAGETTEPPSSMRLRGRVVDGAGAPLAGAHLELTHKEDSSTPIEFETTAEGTFECLEASPGDYSLEVRAIGCVPWAGRLNLPPGFDGLLRDIIVQRGRGLHGRVVNEAGDPVPGAGLYLLEQATSMSPVTEQLAATTTEDGIFELLGLPSHSLYLGVSVQHLVPELVRIPRQSATDDEPLTVELAQGWTANVDIDGLGPRAPRLRIRAMPATGSALANDEFAWRAHTQRRWPVENTQPLRIEGLALGERYYVQLEKALPDGTWRAGDDVPLVSEDAPRVKLSYQPRASLTVTVRSALDGRPVEGFVALVERWGIEWDPLTPAQQAAPSVAGTNHYSVQPGKSMRLRVQADGFASATLDPIVCEAGELMVMPTVRLKPTGVVSVKVRDAQTGQSLEGATLRVREDWTQDPAVWRKRVHTDASGAAQVTIGSRNDAELHVSCKGYEPRVLEKSALADTVTIGLEPACGATVHVLDDSGSPVEGVIVSCKRTSDSDGKELTGMSDLEGRLTFTGLQAGEHIFAVVDTELIGKRIMMGGAVATVSMISVSRRNEETEPVVADVQVGAQAMIEVVVPGRVSLEGRVLDGATPQPGVGLHWINRTVGLDEILSLTMLGDARFTTDLKGRFRLPALPTGEGTLVLEHPGRRFPIAIPLELHSDKEGLEVQLPGATIRGTVHGPEGDPLPGAEVRVGVYAMDGSRMRAPEVTTVDAAGVISVHGGDVPVQRYLTDASGHYVIHNAPVGYSLQLTASAATTLAATETRVLIDGEETDVDFQLGAAGELLLQLRTSNGESARNRMLTLEWSGSGSQAGHERVIANDPSVRIGGLVPGPWTLKVANLADAHGEPTTEEIEIRASESTELTIQVND